MKLTDLQKQCLDFDRKVITQDLKLSMPRLTEKYLTTVIQLSELYFTSPYFLHLTAIKKGNKALYQDFQQRGYTWNSKKKKWEAPTLKVRVMKLS